MWLLGAGSSLPAGMPLNAELLDLVRSRLVLLDLGPACSEALCQTKGAQSIEELVDRLTGMEDNCLRSGFSVEFDKQRRGGPLRECSVGQVLAHFARGFVVERLSPDWTRQPMLHVNDRSAGKIWHLAPLIADRQLVVTLNFDRVVELAASVFGKRSTHVANLTVDEMIGGASHDEIHIAKLHGSVDWTRRYDGTLIRGYALGADGNPEALIGSAAKSKDNDLMEVLTRVSNWMDRTGTRIRVVGYSFGEEHVNKLLRGRRVYVCNGRGFYDSVVDGDFRALGDTGGQFVKEMVQSSLMQVFPDGAQTGCAKLCEFDALL